MRLSARSTFSFAAFFATGLASSAAPQPQSYKLAGPFQPPAGGGDVQELRASPDGTRVAYRADEETYGVFELFIAPVDASAPAVRLSGSMVANGDVAAGAFVFSPDGVYFADQAVDGRLELYSVPLAGGTAVRLNGDLVAGGDVGSARISPDGSRIVYRADQEVDERFELYGRALDGSGMARKLSVTPPAGGDVGFSFEIAADSLRVVYGGDCVVDDREELFKVPITGGPSVRLHATAVEGGDVAGFRLSPDGQRAVYDADLETDGMQELYAVSLQGGGSGPHAAPR
jgi:dipeptidyl aminopeptidase/acylaminoacyl peptidase